MIQIVEGKRQTGVEYPSSLISNTLEQPKSLAWAGTPHWSPVPIMATTSSEEVKEPKNTFLENSAAGPCSNTALKLSDCHIRLGVIAHIPSYHFSSILPCLQKQKPKHRNHSETHGKKTVTETLQTSLIPMFCFAKQVHLLKGCIDCCSPMDRKTRNQ